jgi:hypothetical protein
MSGITRPSSAFELTSHPSAFRPIQSPRNEEQDPAPIPQQIPDTTIIRMDGRVTVVDREEENYEQEATMRKCALLFLIVLNASIFSVGTYAAVSINPLIGIVSGVAGVNGILMGTAYIVSYLR